MQSYRLYTLSKQNKAKNVKLSSHFKALQNTTSTFFSGKKKAERSKRISQNNQNTF